MKLDLEIKDDAVALEKLQEEKAKLVAGPPVTSDAVVYLDKPEQIIASANKPASACCSIAERDHSNHTGSSFTKSRMTLLSTRTAIPIILRE